CVFPLPHAAAVCRRPGHRTPRSRPNLTCPVTFYREGDDRPWSNGMYWRMVENTPESAVTGVIGGQRDEQADRHGLAAPVGHGTRDADPPPGGAGRASHGDGRGAAAGREGPGRSGALTRIAGRVPRPRRPERPPGRPCRRTAAAVPGW